MPAQLGELTLPYHSPHFLTLRVAVRTSSCPPGPIVLGLSGGPDSLALCAAARAEHREVHALCIDHGLQQGSAEIAQHAAAQARSMGATAQVIAVEVARQGSVEAAARHARYAAFAAHADGRPLWLAHTKDDQAETLLLGALRGNPAGMAPHSTMGDLDIWRPLLQARRAATHGACAELGLAAWHDPHNDNEEFLRVKVRRLLAAQLGGVSASDPCPPLAKTADRIAEDMAALEELAAAVYRGVEKQGQLVATALQPHPRALRRRVIATWLRAHEAEPTAASIAAIDQLVSAWHGQGSVRVKRGENSQGKVVGVPPRLAVSRVNGMLTVESVSTSP